MKDYKNWSKVKARINNSEDRPTGYTERQIWWCNVGENVGIESDGKGPEFLRPILIIKKFGYMGFFGIPLTSQTKPNKPFYFPLNVKNKNGFLIFSQARTFDACRLRRKITEIDLNLFIKIKEKFKEYLEL